MPFSLLLIGDDPPKVNIAPDDPSLLTKLAQSRTCLTNFSRSACMSRKLEEMKTRKEVSDDRQILADSHRDGEPVEVKRRSHFTCSGI